MHSYLRAIGFSDIVEKKDFNKILNRIFEDSDNSNAAEIRDGCLFTEISKEFAQNMGIVICGEYSKENDYSMEYSYPYFKGTGVTSNERITVEKHAEKDSYAGVCEDVKVGVSLIFYLNNVSEYINEKRLGTLDKQSLSITLSGLSLSGKILLQINKSEKQKAYTKKLSSDRNKLITQARNGNEEAIESLTLEDMDTYSMISRRILREDVFTIVDSYFMPYGIECDQYSILGEILECEEVENEYTKEHVYIMKLNCNELIFDVCINKKDLLGEPSVGRRFKGEIWLQGNINFPK